MPVVGRYEAMAAGGPGPARYRTPLGRNQWTIPSFPRSILHPYSWTSLWCHEQTSARLVTLA
jgi:hypothetical protein